MSIKINVEKKIIVNGREYKSLDEMPEDLRQAFQKAVSGFGNKIKVSKDTKFVLNGKEFKGVEEIPPEEMEAYTNLIKAATDGSGKLPTKLIADIGESLGGEEAKGSASGYQKPIEPEATFSVTLSPKAVVVGLIVVALVVMVYLFG